MSTEPKYVAETLKWCNRLRAKGGKEPLARLPLGARGDANSCPCGEATGWWIGARIALPPAGHSIRLPVPVRRFVVAFDDGRLPQYDKEKHRASAASTTEPAERATPKDAA